MSERALLNNVHGECGFVTYHYSVIDSRCVGPRNI